ncbi:hypothetical protein N657DRAFT_3733 [Parathielavia appendiculata]|uniref:Uncharacterized protein n=1 Tax=Parathielavia appendiculata TaxID=2587402 RepID=A0AAN6U7X2_9PEZI|nr:hypothetical protein N657DRAFT_3733 [Parathielavia appendiculata]
MAAPLGRVGTAWRLGLPNLTAVGTATFHSALHEVECRGRDRLAGTFRVYLSAVCPPKKCPGDHLAQAHHLDPLPASHTCRWQTRDVDMGPGAELRVPGPCSYCG